MSIKALIILVGILAALVGGVCLMHNPHAMRSLGQAIHGQP